MSFNATEPFVGTTDLNRGARLAWQVRMASAIGSFDTHAGEVAAGQRFEFGANWARFLQQKSPFHSMAESLPTAERSGFSQTGVWL